MYDDNEYYNFNGIGGIMNVIQIIFLFFEKMSDKLQTKFASAYMTDFIEGYQRNLSTFSCGTIDKKINKVGIVGSCAPGNYKKLLFSIGKSLHSYFAFDNENKKNNEINNKFDVFDCDQHINDVEDMTDDEIKYMHDTYDNNGLPTIVHFIVNLCLEKFINLLAPNSEDSNFKSIITNFNEFIKSNEKITEDEYEINLTKVLIECYKEYLNFIYSIWKIDWCESSNLEKQYQNNYKKLKYIKQILKELNDIEKIKQYPILYNKYVTEPFSKTFNDLITDYLEEIPIIKGGYFNIKPKINKSKFNKFKINKSKINKSKINKSKINKSKINKSKINKSKINKPKINKLKTNKYIKIKK